MRFKRFKDKHDTSLLNTSTDNVDGDGNATGGDDIAETPKKKTPIKKTPTKNTPAKDGGKKKRKLDEVDGDETTPVKVKNEEDASLLTGAS